LTGLRWIADQSRRPAGIADYGNIWKDDAWSEQSRPLVQRWTKGNDTPSAMGMLVEESASQRWKLTLVMFHSSPASGNAGLNNL
jgi:hypothetical protein